MEPMAREERRARSRSGLTSSVAAIALACSSLWPWAPAQAQANEKSPPITAGSWTAAVGFEPDASALPLQPGDVVSAANLSQLGGNVPAGLTLLIQKYGLKLSVAPYRPIHPSQGYIDATNAHRGKTVVKDVGGDYRRSGRNDFFPGLPFPRPKTALEVMTNFSSRYTGDDYEVEYDMLWISAKGGLEHRELWHLATVRTVNRTDIEPKPRIESLTSRGIASISYTEALEPYDKKGFGALYTGSLAPADIEGHVYVPAMRRVLRNSFGTRGDSWNATDYLYEDVEGYLGAVEWMNWTLEGKATMLMPAHPNVKQGADPQLVYELDTYPHWNPKANWEPRPVYVVSATPKLPDYPYSRMRMVIDAATFTMYYKEAYDKKGELWKVILTAPNPPRDMAKSPSVWGFGCALDLQSEHASCVLPRRARHNQAPDASHFTLNALRKRGH